MKRQDKYPDTSTFRYYNANPKNRITGDCVVRAVSTATGIPYNEVVMGMAEIWCKTAKDPFYDVDEYMKSIGWVKHKQPRKWDNTKYTGVEFCNELNRGYDICVSGSVVANIGGHHIVAIKEDELGYRVYDIWNSTDGCIGNYWTKG